jgi:hypothetical protein
MRTAGVRATGATVVWLLVCAGLSAGCDGGFPGDGLLPEHPMPGSDREVAPIPEAALTVIARFATAVNATSACSPPPAAVDGAGHSFSVPGTGPCPGCAADRTYTYVDAFDVLRVIYGGFHHDGTYDCNSAVRRALVANWLNIFNCPTGANNCPSGLTHAWRPRDLNLITTGFVGLVGFGTHSIGGSPLITPPDPRTNAFCNSIDGSFPSAAPACSPRACPQGFGCDAPGGHCSMPRRNTSCGATLTCPPPFACSDPTNTNNAATCFPPGCGPGVGCPSGFVCEDPTASSHCVQQCGPSVACPAGFTCSPAGLCTLSEGGRADFADSDPIRIPCTANDEVCDVSGALGLVLPIVLPTDPQFPVTDTYPLPDCSPGACALELLATPAQVVLQNLVCPDGRLPLLGRCFMPYLRNPDGSQTFQCRSTKRNHCFGLTSMDDGRTYNEQLVHPVASRPAGDAVDSLNHLMTGSFFRIHSHLPGITNPGGVTCQLTSDVPQVSCLADSDWCSIGVAPIFSRVGSWQLNGTLDSTLPLPASSVADNVTASSLTISAGLTPTTSTDAFVADNWPAGAFDPTLYFELTLAPADGHSIVYSDVNFSLYNSFDGAVTWEVRSSVDGFVAPLASGSIASGITGAGVALSADVSALGEQPGAVTFRIYTYGNSGATSPLQRGLRGSAAGGSDLSVDAAVL